MKKVLGVICLVAAAALAVSGVVILARGDGPGLDDPSGLGVSRYVGTFLPALVAAILGLWLLGIGAGKKPDQDKRQGR